MEFLGERHKLLLDFLFNACESARFSPKKSVFSGHEWLQFEYRAKRDILEAISEPEYTDFAGGNGGKMQFCLSSIT